MTDLQLNFISKQGFLRFRVTLVIFYFLKKRQLYYFEYGFERRKSVREHIESNSITHNKNFFTLFNIVQKIITQQKTHLSMDSFIQIPLK